MRTPLLFALAAGTLLAAPALAQTATGSKPGAPTASTTNAAGSAGTGLGGAGRTAIAAKARRPAVSTGGVRGLTPRSATLNGSVNPRGQKTRYRFDYGVGTTLNRQTATATLNAGTATVRVSAAAALAPKRRYSYRLVASNAAGTTRGTVHQFTSPRAPAALTFAARSSRVSYEGAAVFTGNATSAGAGGVAVVLERQPFPFTGAFEPVATQRSGSDGSYTFTVSPLLLSAKFRVLARTAPPVTSAPLTVRTKVRVAIKVTRVSGRRVRFSGDIVPSVSGGRVSLQRRSGGRFVTVRRASVRHPSPGRSTYRITTGARRTSTVYRVRVTPDSSTGHARGTSGQRRVAGRR